MIGTGLCGPTAEAGTERKIGGGEPILSRRGVRLIRFAH